MSRGQGPADHLLRLGDVETALGLGAPAQGDIGQPDIVLEALVVGVVDADRHGQKARRWPTRAVTLAPPTAQNHGTAPSAIPGEGHSDGSDREDEHVRHGNQTIFTMATSPMRMMKARSPLGGSRRPTVEPR